ncbi:MAG: FHA domain-containing protein [Thermoproteota archaeon]
MSVTQTSGLTLGVILAVFGIIIILVGLALVNPEYPGAALFPMGFGVLLLISGILLVHFSQQKQQAPTVSPIPEKSEGTMAIPQTGAPTRVVTPVSAGTKTVLAFLEAPNGKLMVSSITQPFYRQDFQGLVHPSVLDTLSQSKPQFTIYFRNGKFFIEDSMSTNGTLLNGRQIRGMGMQPLNDGDVISPAGVINLTFRSGS